jgi:cyclophilin family peptidyl-prolyl cis-trans isomerase
LEKGASVPFFIFILSIILKIMMNRLLVLMILSSLMGTCKPDWKLNPVDVVGQLHQMSLDHPETKIKVKTRLGDFEIEFDKRTPLHRINFIRLVKMGYFDERHFYRNIYDSGIQGGGEFMDRLGYLVPAEYIDRLKPVRGSIAMARYDEGNPEKASSPTEFFIVTDSEQAAPFYKNYVVFGKVTKGMAVVDSIKAEKSYDEKPVVPVTFSISVMN